MYPTRKVLCALGGQLPRVLQGCPANTVGPLSIWASSQMACALPWAGQPRPTCYLEDVDRRTESRKGTTFALTTICCGRTGFGGTECSTGFTLCCKPSPQRSGYHPATMLPWHKTFSTLTQAWHKISKAFSGSSQSHLCGIVGKCLSLCKLSVKCLRSTKVPIGLSQANENTLNIGR